MTATATAPEPETKPQRYEFPAEPWQPAKEEERFIPPTLRAATVELGSNKTPHQYADIYGLFWVEIKKRCTGLHGQFLYPGDKVQLPGNIALLLFAQKQADFMMDAQTKKEVDLLKQVEEMGFDVKAPQKKVLDREEFQHLKKKKPGFVQSALDKKPTK